MTTATNCSYDRCTCRERKWTSSILCQMDQLLQLVSLYAETTQTYESLAPTLFLYLFSVDSPEPAGAPSFVLSSTPQSSSQPPKPPLASHNLRPDSAHCEFSPRFGALASLSRSIPSNPGKRAQRWRERELAYYSACQTRRCGLLVCSGCRLCATPPLPCRCCVYGHRVRIVSLMRTYPFLEM